jgi:hypothetical protein
MGDFMGKLPSRSWLEALVLPIEEAAMMTTAVRGLAGLTTVLGPLQAILIGQAPHRRDMTKLTLHGRFGSGSLAAAVLLVATVVIAMRCGETERIDDVLGDVSAGVYACTRYTAPILEEIRS